MSKRPQEVARHTKKQEIVPGTQEEGAAPTWTGGLWVDDPGLPDLLGLQG